MKKIILGLNLILLLSTFSFAQKQKKDPNEIENQSVKQSNQTNRESNETINNSFLEAGTNLEAQLQKTLDVKNTKAGDTVILKVTKEIKQNGEIVVPKGSKLIGRVTEAQEKTKSNAISKLSIVFDRIEGKNLNAPINATIFSITQAASSAAVGEVFSSDLSGSSSSSGSVSSGGASSGGLLGGVGGVVGTVVNTATNTAGTAANTAGQAVGGTTQTLGNNLRGIQISQSAEGSANASTTLSSRNMNLRLEKGATFRVQLNK